MPHDVTRLVLRIARLTHGRVAANLFRFWYNRGRNAIRISRSSRNPEPNRIEVIGGHANNPDQMSGASRPQAGSQPPPPPRVIASVIAELRAAENDRENDRRD